MQRTRINLSLIMIAAILCLPGVSVGCDAETGSGPGAETGAEPGAETGAGAPGNDGSASTMGGYTSPYNPAHISSGEAWELFNSSGCAIIIDVRSRESYLQRRVSVAVNVTYDELADYAAANIPDKDCLIVTYCFCDGKGGPALSARDLLTQLGYTNVFYMDPEDEWTYLGTDVPDAADSSPGQNLSRIITGEEAKIIMDSNDTALLLDVRNPDEYEEKHIEGSLNIPVSELEGRLSELPDKDAAIIVFCKAGRRSAAACKILIGNGYTNVLDMQTIDNWPG